MRHAAGFCLLGMWCVTAVGSAAQSRAQDDPAPFFRSQTRLVLEDVLVSDKNGNPVHGLPASAFHVLDNGNPQQIRDFSEGSPPPTGRIPDSSLPVGTFSNRTTEGAAPTVAVLLLDADNTSLLEQMYLLKQLQAAVGLMPSDLPVSVFSVANGRATPLLIASTDRAALLRVLKDALPLQTVPVDSKFNKAVDQLFTIASYLQQTPGRKNLLWFASAFPLVSVAPGEQQAGGLLVSYTTREHQIHLIQEALAEARIAVYPVDPRGVLGTLPGDTAGSPTPSAAAQRDVRGANAASTKREVGPPAGANDTDERSQMRKMAEATGGRAYFLNNLTEEIDQAFDLGRSA